jgi:hypothetical protein
VHSLMAGAKLRAPASTVAQPEASPAAFNAAVERITALPPESQRVIRVDLTSVPDHRTVLWYPNFGLIIVKGSGFFLSLRCARSYRADAPTGHLHDDNLALELYADGHLLVYDPGVFVYTSLPHARNAYRAAAAHHAPRARGWDATAIDPGLLFQCPSALPARLLYGCIDGLAAELPGPRGAVLLRTIEISAPGLTIRDGVENGTLRPLTLPPPYCRGYGKRTNTVADIRFLPPLGEDVNLTARRLSSQ